MMQSILTNHQSGDLRKNLPFPNLDLGFKIVNSVRRLHLKSNHPSNQHLHKDLHSDGDRKEGNGDGRTLLYNGLST